MEAIDALETEARALEDEAEALDSRGLTVAALVRLQRAKSKRNQAQSLFNAGVSVQAGSYIDVNRLAETVADLVVERQQIVPDAISCSLSSVRSAQLQAMQRRLNFRTSPARVPEEFQRGPHNVDSFNWAPYQHEDHAALAAMQYLQDHMAPNDVQFVAVQSVRWLGFDWVKERISLRTGRTDILGAFTGKGGQELVTKLLAIQRSLVDLKQQLTEAQKQLEQVRKMKPSILLKRQREERVQATQQIADEKHALQAEYDGLCRQRLDLVADLLMHTVMAYEAKHPSKLQRSLSQYNQACASYLVLNANQLANSKSHPGSIVVLGNYNETIIYAPSGVPAGPTRNDPPAVINTVATSDTGPERASAARLIKGLLLERCRVLAQRAAAIFDYQGIGGDAGGGDGGGTSGGGGSASHGWATRGSLRGNEGPSGANPDTSGSMSDSGGGADIAGGSGGSQGTSTRRGYAALDASSGHVQERSDWAEDIELHSHELLAGVLKKHLSQPHVYSSLGLRHPPSNIPVSEAQDWLDNMCITGVAQPIQAHS